MGKFIIREEEKLRYVLLKHNLSLIACPPRKLKELICAKMNPTPKDKLAGVHVSLLKTIKNNIMVCIKMTKG